MAEKQRAATRYPFEFTGSGWEYFKIWIVNVLLSIVTLYIYSAWAKVRTKRYFYGNTLLDNSSFEYHATPMQILKGRLIAIAALIIAIGAEYIHPLATFVVYGVFLLLLPWVIYRSTRFNAMVSSYRNIRFDFWGIAWPYYKYVLIIPFLPLFIGAGILVYGWQNGQLELFTGIVLPVAIFAFYAMVPLTNQLITNYSFNHYQYGTSNFSASLTIGKYYKIYISVVLIGLLLLLLVVGIIGLILYLSGLIGPELFQVFAEQSIPPEYFGFLIGSAGVFYILLLFIGIFLNAYLRTRLRNYSFSKTQIARSIGLVSTVKVWPLWWVFTTNILAVIATLGLAYPWSKVRLARYYANNTAIYSLTSLDKFVGKEERRQSSLGEELGDAFDMGVDLGF